MAIAVVQSSPVGKFNGSLTATCTLTGVTAGNSIFVLVSHANGDASPATAVTNCYDGAIIVANKFLGDKRVQTGSNRAAEVHHKHSAAAGTHVISSVAAGGAAANSSGQIMAVEVSGLDSSQPVDQVGGTGNTGVAPTATLAGALAVANEIAFSVLTGLTSLAGATTPPSSAQGTFVNLLSDLGTAELPCVFSYVIVSATTAISCSWATLNASAPTATAMASYKIQPSGGFTMVAEQGSYSKIGSSGTLDFFLMANNGTEAYSGQTAGLNILLNPVMLADYKAFVMAKKPNILTYVSAPSLQRTWIGTGSHNNVAGMRTSISVLM